MLIRKWRPFWSYDVEATEKWLNEQANDGFELVKINRTRQLFYFKNSDSENPNYQIVYDKEKYPLSQSLINAGWTESLNEGKWMFLKNDNEKVSLSPARDGIFKRNKLVTNILTTLSVLYGFQLFMVLSFFLVIFFANGSSSIESSPLWSLTIIYFLQVIAVIIFTLYGLGKVRKFEQKYFNSKIDSEIVTGETFSKWKLGWNDNPKRIEKWLEQMATKGYRLSKISNQSGRFIFEKTEGVQLAYTIDFQWKVSPAYYDTHKSAGWKLKYSSPFSFLKYSVWEKEYEQDEQKPQLSYNDSEEISRVRKLHLGNLVINSFPLLIIIYFLTVIIPSYPAYDWRLLDQVLIIAVCISSLFPISRVVRSIMVLVKS